MAHCLPPMGLCQRQKNQGEEEEQERVRGEPSLVIVPNLGNLDTISIPLASSPLNRRRGRRRGYGNVMLSSSLAGVPAPTDIVLGDRPTDGAREPHRPAPVSSMHGHTLSRPQLFFFFFNSFHFKIFPKYFIVHCIFETHQYRSLYSLSLSQKERVKS